MRSSLQAAFDLLLMLTSFTSNEYLLIRLCSIAETRGNGVSMETGSRRLRGCQGCACKPLHNRTDVGKDPATFENSKFIYLFIYFFPFLVLFLYKIGLQFSSCFRVCAYLLIAAVQIGGRRACRQIPRTKWALFVQETSF